MSKVDLSQRSSDPEIMDDLSCNGEVVEQTLRELDFINRWLGGNAVTLSGIKMLLAKTPVQQGPISIADLGCGSGDLLRQLADYGRTAGITLQLKGIDANPHIVAYARNHCKGYPEISFETADVLSVDFSHQTFDIITGTLFFHHFSNETLQILLPRLVQQAKLGVLINDIHRHPLAFHSIRLLTRFFSSSPMVRYDAPLSVRRAFTRDDWNSLLRSTGLHSHQLTWKWAFRWRILLPGAAG